VKPNLTMFALALSLWALPAQATPERAAQMQAADPAPQAAPAAMPADMGGMGMGADGEFPPAMMAAIAAQEAGQAQQADGAAMPPAGMPAAAMPAAAMPAAAMPAPAEPDLDSEPAPQLSEAPAGEPVTDRAVIDARARVISEGLRCPVCQGLSAADSQAESAIAMRTRSGDLVAAGYSDAQINTYFVERYGEWVLLEPPRSGRHWLIWLGPLAFLGLGALIVAWRMTSQPEPAKSTITVDDADEDPYEKRILDELEGN